MIRSGLLGVAAALALAGAATAQEGSEPTDTYLDPVAESLHVAARANWAEIDETVRRYTARVQQRIAAMIRAPLKDRVLYRNESAARVFWDRDYDTFIQALGARAQHPGSELDEIDGLLEELTIDEAFDPGGDRLIFGFASAEDSGDPDRGDDEFWVEHPLAPGADSLYRYESGDSLTLSLPDGRTLRTVQLMVIPRRLDVHLISGALWIEPETGALVRAVYRLADEFDAMREIEDLREEEEAGSFRYVPGIFKPWTFDLKIVAIDYTLWDFKVWLPRSMRVEGQAGAGILKFPVEMDLAYRIENVVLEEDLGTEEYEAAVLEERHFETRAEAMAFLAELMSQEDGMEFRTLGANGRGGRGSSSRYIAPATREELRSSEHLPPPIWEDAPGFASESDLEDMIGELADIPLPQVAGIPWAANWGWQRPDLLRYNRIEGPAVGARFEARFGSFAGPIGFRATGFLGVADLDPKVRVDFTRTGVRRRVELGVYRDIHTVQPRGRHLELGNSLNALLFGRDEGEYYRATGVDLTLSRPDTERQNWTLKAWAERHDALFNESRFALNHAFDGDWSFRQNLTADALEEVGGSLQLTPWWGGDPLLPQFGMELEFLGAAFRTVPEPGEAETTSEYARAQAILRAAIPLADARWRVGLELGGGTSWGDLPTQRSFLVGGVTTLRGYDQSEMVGSTYGRARLEIGRRFAATTLSLFGDAGWAGERDAWDADDLLYSVGIGGSVLDGLIRMDLSRGLTGDFARTRLDLYLDAIL